MVSNSDWNRRRTGSAVLRLFCGLLASQPASQLLNRFTKEYRLVLLFTCSNDIIDPNVK